MALLITWLPLAVSDLSQEGTETARHPHLPSLNCVNVIRFSLLNHLLFSNGLKDSLEVKFTPAVSIPCGTPPPSNYIYLLWG